MRKLRLVSSRPRRSLTLRGPFMPAPDALSPWNCLVRLVRDPNAIKLVVFAGCMFAFIHWLKRWVDRPRVRRKPGKKPPGLL